MTPPPSSEQPTGTPGLLVAAPRSGSGKTTIALALMRALRRRGLAVQPFKCGPDYIDPAWHAAAAGRDSVNLDSWAMRPALLRGLVGAAGPGAEIAIVEGVMGLFDGVAQPGRAGRGASADIAALTGWPVLLVLDVAGQTETAAAVALGCARYRADVSIAGVILNRVASDRHLALVAPTIERLGLPVLGAVFRDDRLALPERHLGLVQAVENSDLDAQLDRIAAVATARIDLDALVAAARPGMIAAGEGDDAGLPPPGGRVALARDAAFSFMYPHLIQAWRRAGAAVVPFSPLADEAPDAAADAVWLPGGYPELHAGRLAAAETFRSGMRAAAERGARIHGECGGFMVLGQGLVDADGTRHAMLDLLGLETSFATRKLHLGYRRATLRSGCVLGPAGATLYGHEFHYATTLACPDAPLADCCDATGASVPESGARRGTVTGTFFHAIDRGA
ncbi:cobyrinate a,c-diamide synthase [Rhodoplanes sp. TEM]|uniref:Hydrogenobyrinate a,c-diamide synthase n=1 Tax=Rhodoplanes tepidamans TaxID=200616 RepID=A0ABT5J8I8_RHOTP|nr:MULTISPECIES: cobyrinate a,c-diamide synthase [Rhodoplanes]MDC7785891.1 cobyrinate a,c-diamide synthase [Rhodoplanes tepidamans]MDC7985003.1 cobyrinate a,c-diamide synthase [Rhodoplanes sp. TEM]MDQ0355491.1 cobyrinic acid a,c-diamide synthase [Rhodoplanes tepidamans]